MIQIYSVRNTNYEKNGDALLPSSASVHVILNGAWEAELTHPLDKEGRWKNIVEEAVVKMPSFNGDQLFRIKAVEKQDSGVTATMEPIFYDAMNDCFLEDIRPNGDSGQAALTKMLSPNNKYSASSNITKTATAYYQYVNFLEALNGDLDQSFIKRWGGEILFDNYTVIVNERVGGDYGAELRYGKNIPKNGMSFDVDNRDIVTRIYPKAYEGRMMSDNGYVDSPLINNYPTVKAATMTFENVKLSSDLQGDPEDTDIVCDTQAELDQALTELCEAQFSEGLDKPKVTISVDMVLLQNTEQYKDVKNLEEVSLGDTVRIYNRHLGIMSEARIIELEYDAIRKKVSSVVIGDYEYNYFNDVSSATEIIKNVVNPDGTLMAERVQGILNGVYTQLRLQSTAAQKVDGVAFKVEELDDESPLYGCMIWGTQGIQISTTRTADGKDWDWTTAITAKGIVANAIITGLLSDKTGNNYWDLDTGEFRLSSTYVKIDGDNIGDYVDSTLTQQEVFNKLTNNGAAKGLYLTADNELYINATYIKTGIITDNIGNNYWNLATGEFRLSSTATVGGNTIATKNNTISNVDVEYASGTSNTTPPTSGWATTAPDWQEGRYIWQRTVTTMQNGTQNISDPTCIQGAAGENGEAGATGIGVSQIVEQYYLSTSSTTQTGGSWSTAQPKWQKGKYIWTRSQITWTDNSVTYTDPVLAKAINGANEAVDDLDTSLNQQEVFNRLTNNGQAQGIILQNGRLYINATYIKTGIITDNIGNNYWNLQTGEFRLSDTTTLGGDSIATKNDVTDLDDSLNQQEVFNRLTNNGAAKGIALVNGVLYINADYINSGTVKGNFINAKNLVVTDRSGNTTFAIDSNGNVTIRAASFSLQGSSIQSIADDAADSALTSANNYTDTKASSTLSSAQNYADNEASNALQQAKKYTDLQIENFDPDLTQQEVFNILTNNGQTQGIYLSGGRIYINASYIGSGIISASRIASSSISAGLITADKISISDLRSLSATIGGIKIGSQGLATSNGLLRFYNDGRIVFNNRVTLEAEGNGMSIRTGLTIYSSSGGDFSDGTGLINFRGIGSTTGGTYLVAQGNLNSIAKRSSSSKRYKDHIRDLDDEEALSILDIPVVVFKYKDGYLVKGDLLEGKPIPGFYAEDVEEVDPILCQYNLDGSVEDWNYRTMIPYMLKTMQIQQKRIDDLEARIAKLEKGEINA